MGDDLKFIDFHQLQIENKKHVKEIDERNKTLLQLKLKHGTSVQTLNTLKKKLAEAQDKATMIEKEMETKKASLDKKLLDIKKTEKIVS